MNLSLKQTKFTAPDETVIASARQNPQRVRRAVWRKSGNPLFWIPDPPADEAG